MSKSNLNILSYNVHLFEKSLASTIEPELVYQDENRLLSLFNCLSRLNFDIIGLTEVWSHKIQNEVKNFLKKYNMNSYAFQGEPDTKGSAGLVLGFKGKNYGGMGFEYYQNMVGPDSFSSKGVAYGILNIQGSRIFIVQTHTQASYTGTVEKDDTARKLQIEQTLFPILDKALENHPKVPIFLLGDLNIVAGTSQYKWFKNQLHLRGLNDAWVTANNGTDGITYDPENNKLVKHFDPTQKEQQRLDYIFSTEKGIYVDNMQVEEWKTQDGIDISDHYGVIGEFNIY